jgi:3-hydroxybutyryl-CoA dehydrogenase
MDPASIHTLLVCGAGTMGSGIAETAAKAGYRTILYDPADIALQKASATIERSLAMLVEKERITSEQKTKAFSLLTFTSNISDCRGDLIIEAIVEDLEIKRRLFQRLADAQPADTILASNTSSLSITDIAAAVPHPERVCGLHFFNPAPVMKLVEVVETQWSGPAVIRAVQAWVKTLGKTAVVCRDSPGFIVNRVARHYYLEALALLGEGVADVETIDRVMENAGFRMGPFRLMDLIGNDINLAVTESLYEACGRPERFRPSPIQQEKVARGELGRKTGKGYYTY